MRFFAVSCLCVVVLFAIIVGVRSQQHCCMAQKFQATVTDLRTINTARIRNTFMTVDFGGRKQATVDQDFDPVTKQIETIGRMVTDFNQKMAYFIPGNNPSECQKRPFDFEMFHNCLPENGNYLGSTYVGLPGTLEYDGWRYPYPGTTNTLNITIAVARQGCVPIVQGIVGDMNGPVDFLWYYTTYVPDQIDPSVFDLPPSCNQ